MCAEVYMYHSTGKLCTCMPFYNVLTQNLIPLEGTRGQSLLLLPTVTAVYPHVRTCVRPRAYMRTEVNVYHSTGTISTYILADFGFHSLGFFVYLQILVAPDISFLMPAAVVFRGPCRHGWSGSVGDACLPCDVNLGTRLLPDVCGWGVSRIA